MTSTVLLPVDPSRSGSSITSFTQGFAPASANDFVKHQLPFYEEQYVRIEDLRVATCTFNVATKKPPADLSFFNPVLANQPDLIVIGLQEVDMSASALLREETEAGWPWLQGIASVIGCDHVPHLQQQNSNPAVTSSQKPYFLICSRQLVGLMLIVCGRRSSLQGRIREVAVSTVATGALGTVANKGAIGIRIRCERSNFCFLNCHLAAHQHAVSKRNEDITDILSRMNLQISTTMLQDEYVGAQFSNGPSPAQVQITGNPTGLEHPASFAYLPTTQFKTLQQILATGQPNPSDLYPILPKDCDQLVVLGDLNYRVDLPYETAVSLCSRSDVKALLKEDQLSKEVKHPHSPWFGFTDLTPSFLPTYRFDIGTDTYDTSEKRRVPSYTDRILFWKKHHRHVTPTVSLVDSIHKQATCSDHKPVYALMTLPLKSIDQALYDQTTSMLQQLVQEIGLQNDQLQPSISISQTELDFGECISTKSSATAAVSKSLTIRNTSKTVAEIAVLRRTLASDPSDATWLRVAPSSCHFFVLPSSASSSSSSSSSSSNNIDDSTAPGEYRLDVSCVVDWSSLRWMVNELPFQASGNGSGTFTLKSDLAIVVRPFYPGGGAGSSKPGAESMYYHRVHCSCTVRPSCHAMTLDALLRCGNIPVVDAFALPSSAAITDAAFGGRSFGASGATGSSLVAKPQIPKELWYLADAISKYPHVPGLFPTEFATEQDGLQLLDVLSRRSCCLENVAVCPAEQCPPESTSIYAVSTALIVFLRDLQVSVIPAGLLAAAVAASKAGPSAVMKFTTEQLPTAHYNVFIYVMSLLRFLLRPQHVASNELTPQILAQVFAVVLFSLSSQVRPTLGGKPTWFSISTVGSYGSNSAPNNNNNNNNNNINHSEGASGNNNNNNGTAGQPVSGGNHRAQADEEFSCAANFILSFL